MLSSFRELTAHLMGRRKIGRRPFDGAEGCRVSALLELNFTNPWKATREGRMLRWRRIRPLQPLGLRVRLQEKHGESVEVEFAPFAGAEEVLDGLEKMRADFIARFPPPMRPGERGKGNQQQATRAA